MNELEQATCKRCGRKLRNQKAIEIGMGETCWKKWKSQNNHKKLWKVNNNEKHKKEKLLNISLGIIIVLIILLAGHIEYRYSVHEDKYANLTKQEQHEMYLQHIKDK